MGKIHITPLSVTALVVHTNKRTCINFEQQQQQQKKKNEHFFLLYAIYSFCLAISFVAIRLFVAFNFAQIFDDLENCSKP